LKAFHMTILTYSSLMLLTIGRLRRPRYPSPP
jgi:hypothetical protein